MRTKQFGDKDFCRAVSRLKGVKAKEKQPDGRWLYWDISLDDIDPHEIRERLDNCKCKLNSCFNQEHLSIA